MPPRFMPDGRILIEGEDAIPLLTLVDEIESAIRQREAAAKAAPQYRCPDCGNATDGTDLYCNACAEPPRAPRRQVSGS